MHPAAKSVHCKRGGQPNNLVLRQIRDK